MDEKRTLMKSRLGGFAQPGLMGAAEPIMFDAPQDVPWYKRQSRPSPTKFLASIAGGLGLGAYKSFQDLASGKLHGWASKDYRQAPLSDSNADVRDMELYNRNTAAEALGGGAAMALNAMGTSTAFPVPKNALRTFGGKNAKTADIPRLNQAERLYGEGVDRQQIWDRTGWFQGKDGNWRFEIDDSQAVRNDWGAAHDKADFTQFPQAMPMRMDHHMSHPGVEAAYWPNKMDSPKVYYNDLDIDTGGYYTPSLDSITMNKAAIPLNRDKSIMLHEQQHAIQTREGWSRGDNPDNHTYAQYAKDILNPKWQKMDSLYKDLGVEDKMVVDYLSKFKIDKMNQHGAGWESKLNKKERAWWDDIVARARRQPEADAYLRANVAFKKLSDKYTNPSEKMVAKHKKWAEDRYRADAGEVEARLVQKRMDYTPEQRRARAPWRDYDTSERRQTVSK